MQDEGGPLYSPAVVSELLTRHGLRADKSFGQNFLIDGNILEIIVEAAAVGVENTVLEIGPGLGVLTRALAEKAERVVSVELDERLLPLLEETTGYLSNVEIVAGDGLEYDMGQLPPESLLVANLPYNVGTPILLRALNSGRFKRIVVMVQREVAERLSAAPGSGAYGSLSPIVAQYGSVTRVKNVPPSAFFPAPEVMSSVVRVEVDPDARADPELTEFIYTAFRHRRKTLKKNLLIAGYDKVRVAGALEAVELDPKVRAEAVGLEAFRALWRQLEG